MNYRTVLTTCPYCGVGCGIYLEVLDGEIIGTLPAKTHPVNEGRLCIKGWYAHEVIGHADRLKTPLVKKGTNFTEVSWDEALKLVASKIKEIKDKYGADSIGVISSARCTNEENYLAQKFARAVIGTNNVDHCARTCHSPTVCGLVASFGSGAMTNSIGEIQDADCIFIIGSNTTEAHPVIGWRLYQAKDKGAKLIVADPRRIQVAQLADIHLQHLPGTDIALLNGIMNVIISEGLEDKEFIKSRTEGFEELKKVIVKYTPEYVAKITAVAPELIIEAAKTYAGGKKASILYTLGITEHTVGTKNVMSVANLAMITGSVGKESSGVNPLRGQNNVQGACDMAALPNVYPGYQNIEVKENRQKFEKAWEVSLSPQKGLTLTDMIYEAKKGNIAALYVIGEDLIVSNPNTGLVKEALENLELLVVEDIFMNEVGRLADVILPASSFAEKEGTFTNSERRVQRVRKAIEPLEGTRPDWEIICQLAEEMGYNKMDYRNVAEIMDEIAMLAPIYGGVSFERIENIGLQWPCPDRKHPGTKYLHREKFSRGLGKLYGIEHEDAAEMPDKDYPFTLTTGRILFQYNAGTMSRRTKELNLECERSFVEINFQDAAKLNIQDNSKVRVTTRRGKIVTEAKVTHKLKQGVIWMPFHFAESCANVLTNDAACPTARTGEYKVCAAKIEPLKRN